MENPAITELRKRLDELEKRFEAFVAKGKKS